MKDELSREELIGLIQREIDGLDIASKMVNPDDPKDEEITEALKWEKQAYEQIKSLLAPIPEDKLKNFKKKMEKELMTNRYMVDYFVKEYNKLREGKEG